MIQSGFDFSAPSPVLPPLMQPASDESEQSVSRLRVYEVLHAASGQPVTTPQLIEQSRCYAAVRRVWELSRYYGYRIIGEKQQRNAWTWTLVGPEPWARHPLMPWRQAKKLEDERTKNHVGNAPTGQVGRG